MDEKLLRESIRMALKEVKIEEVNETKEEETFVPKEKEHLTENRQNLGQELLRRWKLLKKKEGK